MKLQKATRCALFAILELANRPDEQISAADIAATYSISVNHLAKVLRNLSQAGMIESMRGAGGGYRFSGNAKRITLFDVIQLFEPVCKSPRDVAEPGDASQIGRALARVTSEIDAIACATLKSITLDTLLKTMDMHDENARAAEAAIEVI